MKIYKLKKHYPSLHESWQEGMRVKQASEIHMCQWMQIWYTIRLLLKK